MKKIMKTLLIATASVGVIASATTAVISCGATPPPEEITQVDPATTPAQQTAIDAFLKEILGYNPASFGIALTAAALASLEDSTLIQASKPPLPTTFSYAMQVSFSRNPQFRAILPTMGGTIYDISFEGKTSPTVAGLFNNILDATGTKFVIRSYDANKKIVGFASSTQLIFFKYKFAIN